MKPMTFIKTSIAVGLLAISSVVSAADPINIFEDHEEIWYAHPESFKLAKGGTTAMLTKKPKDSNKSIRFHVAILHETCRDGSGELYLRMKSTDDWEVLTSVSIPAETTVGDKVAKILCAVGDHLKKKTNTKV